MKYRIIQCFSRLLLAGALTASLSIGALSQSKPDPKRPWVPVRVVLSGKKNDQLVYVEGTVSKVVADATTPNTKLYGLHDVYGTDIRVRTSEYGDLQLGTAYGVSGTVIREGRETVIVEKERMHLAKLLEPGPSPLAGGGANGTTTKDEKKKDDKKTSDKSETDKKEDESPTKNPAILAIVGVVIVAAIGTLYLSNAKKQEAAKRARAERERLIQSQVASTAANNSRKPTEALSPAPSPLSATPVHVGTVTFWGRLEVIGGPGTGTLKFPLDGSDITIGREQGTVRLKDDATVSSEHGRIFVTSDGRVVYEDLSKNGSKVNGQVVHRSQTDLKSGDVLEVGMTTLKFEGRPPASSAGSASPSTSEAVTGLVSAAFNSSAPTGLFTGGYLELVEGPGKGRTYTLTSSRTTIGRRDDQIVKLEDNAVSREQCVVESRDSHFVLVGASAKGTYVGSDLVSAGSERTLASGDEIRMGGTVLKFTTSVPVDIS